MTSIQPISRLCSEGRLNEILAVSLCKEMLMHHAVPRRKLLLAEKLHLAKLALGFGPGTRERTTPTDGSLNIQS